MLTFSSKRKYSGNISFSPDSNFFAISKGIQLVLYSSQLLKPIKIYTFIDFIEDIKWSNDNQLILIGIYKRNRCEIRSIQNDNYLCTIDEGVQGMSYALFSPDSLHVLSTNEHATKLTIRSLQNKYLSFINLPKFSKKGISFSSQGHGNFMALAERKETKDIIGLYYIRKWTCIRRFEVDTEDLQDIKWSYDNSSLIIIDTPALCRFFIYSILGEMIRKIDIYNNQLGIKNFEISPNGHFFCFGLYDQSLRIYNSISYTCMTIFDHDKDILYDNKINYYKEEIINSEGETKYIELKPPIDLKSENIYLKGKNLFNDKMPKIGISKMSFSYDNNFLATKNDNMPNVLFIWELNLMNLFTVLIHLNEVIYFNWSKEQNYLFISTNNNKLYYFTVDSCKILELSKDFHNQSLILSDDGRKMMVKDTNNFIMVNIDYENIQNLPNPNYEGYQGDEQEIGNEEGEEQYEEQDEGQYEEQYEGQYEEQQEGEQGEEYEGEQQGEEEQEQMQEQEN